MTDLLLLACTLHNAGIALVSHRGHLYGLSGRGMWIVTDLATAATALPKHLWAQA